MKKFLAITMAAAMALMMAGCGGAASSTASKASSTSKTSSASTASSGASSTAVKPVTLNVAYMPNYSSLVEVVTADQMGYFKEQGITVNLVEFADGPTIIAAMENGSIDIGYIGSGAHKLCINGRAKIFAFAHCGNGDAVLGLKSHGVEKAADLKGKTVGYASGTSSEAILNKTLASAGLTIKDVKAMEMDASGIVSAMISGSLDACALWSPSTMAVTNELKGDAVKIADNLTFADQSASISSWICMSKYADANHDILVRYVKALYKAKDYRADTSHAEQISKWIAEKCGLDYNTVYAQRGDAEWLTSAEMLKKVNDGTLEKLYLSQQKGFIASGDVAKEVPVSDYVMFDLMKEAAK